jgi:hypothetical protein
MSSNLHFFPQNYNEARQKFLSLIGTLDCPKSLESWKVPSRTDADLAVDVAYFPASAKPDKLFIIISGTHGLEAYAGHAIQAMFLKEIFPKLDRSTSGFLVVHSLNPWGFKHHRRGTENEVNLNRNCSASDDLYKTKNDESVRLSEKYVPKKPVDSLKSYFLQNMRQDGGRLKIGDQSFDEIIKAVGMGQYSVPSGLEFGGFGPEPQIAKLRDKLKELIPQFKDIVLFDLHTGLVHRARLHLLTGDTDGSVDPAFFKELFHVEADRDVYEFTPADDEGFYSTYGATNNMFPEIAKPPQRVAALTMEFGTLGHSIPEQIEGLNQWLLEHQGGLYGYATPELEKIVKKNYLEKFFPSDSSWRDKVVVAARELFLRVFRRAHLLK